MRYKERVIKHNIDIPELRTVGYSDMTEIHYDPSVVSHHPRSFEYYFTHGIVVNEKRYIIKEFFVRDSKLYAVVTEDENKYYELYLSFMEEDTVERIKKELEDLKEQVKTKQTLSLSDRVLTISGGNSVTLPSLRQTISKKGNKIVLSDDGGEVTVEPYNDSGIKQRLVELESRQDRDSQTLNINGRTISISGGNSILLPEDRDTIYNDEELRRRIQVVESKTDNFVSGVSVSREGNKVKLTYTFINGDHKEVEFEDKDTITLAYDDTALKSRVKSLEDKPDIAVHRFYDGDISGNGARGTSTTVNKSNFRNPDGLKVGDTVEDQYTNANGVNRGIWKVTEVSGDNVKVQGLGSYDIDLRKTLTINNDTRVLSLSGGNSVTLPSDKQTIIKEGNKLILSGGGGEVTLPQHNNTQAYDDTSLRNRIIALENKRDNDTIYNDTDVKRRITELENKPREAVHRFYNGDIPGRGDSNTQASVRKSFFRNPDGIKIGDTVEDYYADQNTVNRGIWKVVSVDGDNVKVQGIGNYDIALQKTLGFNPSTRVLSISGGNNVTIPSDKQTISKSGNKIVLSNGGGEVEIPTPAPYNDSDVKRRLGALETKRDNDNQTLSIANNRLTISGGNSVDIPHPNLSGYVTVQQYNELKGALETILHDLKNSGAWQQTGGNIFAGRFYADRHIATGNINLFGGTPDGASFIRTSNNRTENDLAGGI